VKSAFILLPFLIVALYESGTRKSIFWSIIVYNKYVSNQCNCTARKEPVQDKIIYLGRVKTSCIWYKQYYYSYLFTDSFFFLKIFIAYFHIAYILHITEAQLNQI